MELSTPSAPDKRRIRRKPEYVPDDPLLTARSAAYAQSFTRREGEHKAPSAISTAETGK